MKKEDYVYARIKELLDQYGMTYYNLVQKTGLAKSTIYGIRNKTSFPEHETIKRICEDGFGIDVNEFYQRTDECDYVLTMKERECIDIFRQVPKKDADKALSYMKWLADCGRN
jgi:transcriptional regulator with XRE-family HTH domain